MTVDFIIGLLVLAITGILMIMKPYTMWKLSKNPLWRHEYEPTEVDLLLTRLTGVFLIIGAIISLIAKISS